MLTSASMVFYALATLILFSSVMVVASRSPIVSALFLVFDLFLLACVYASLNAHFVAVIQLLVYAGAILVLFLFVIMLLNTEQGNRKKLRLRPVDVFFIFLAVAVLLFISYQLFTSQLPITAVEEVAGSNTEQVGKLLFVKYLWAFELASFLILLAMVASIIIAKNNKRMKT